MPKSVPTYVAILGITYDFTSRRDGSMNESCNVTRVLDYELVFSLTCVASTGKWQVANVCTVAPHRPYYVAGIRTWRRFVGYNT